MNELNEVEKCLMNCPGVKLYVKSISRRTGIKTKKVTYLCHHSEIMRKVNPLEVGSNKAKLNVFILN